MIYVFCVFVIAKGETENEETGLFCGFPSLLEPPVDGGKQK